MEGGEVRFPVDRISNLPESIISHILSLLPTKSAVRTSFLSKGWKLRWTTITAFNFDDQLWPDDKTKPEMNFSEFVNMVFLTHTDPIHKLRLRWHSYNLRPVCISIWLNTAIARNVRHVDLAAVIPTPNHDDEVKLPSAVYTIPTLTHLKLQGPFRVKLPHGVFLPKLTLLELRYVRFESEESVEKLISACPVLRSFLIHRRHYHGDGDSLVCKVSSHSLKCLEILFFEGCVSCAFSEVKLVVDTPALEYLDLYCDAISHMSCVQRAMPVTELEISANDGIAELLQACPDVKVLKLWESAMLSLGRGFGTATFGGLTKLVVEVPRSHWSSFWDFIARCIKLQVLDIMVMVDEIQDVDEAERLLESLGAYWRRPIHVPSCLSSSIKQFYFRAFEGDEDEMAMLKFMLDHGSLIERVHLCTDDCNRALNPEQKLNLLKEVSMLSRASPPCKIFFT